MVKDHPHSGDDVETMLKLGREVLGVPGLTETDDLFDAGMTSLIALELSDRLTLVLGRNVTVLDVYDGGTLQRISQMGGTAETPADQPSAVTAKPFPTGTAPLSRTQERFWLAEQLAPAAADNVLMLGYLITGPLDRRALERAFAKVIDRHAALRTRYLWDGDNITQEVLPSSAVDVSIESIKIAASITVDWWSRPFELDRRPPWRIGLCRVDRDRHLLVMHIHHIAFDGLSQRIFIDDLCWFSRHDLGTGSAGPLPAVLGCDDYARYESGLAVDDAEISFWRKTLASVPAPFLPPPPGDESALLELVQAVPATTVSEIQATARSRRVPALAVLVAATARALAQVFGVADLCLGTVTDGRRHPVLDGVVGSFINPIALPVRSAAGRDIADLVDRVAHTVLMGLQHSRTPFDEIIQVLRPDRGRHPWFQVLVILQHEAPRGELSLGVTIETVRIAAPRTATELSVEAFPQPDGGWMLQLGWREDGCDPGAVVLVAKRLAAVLGDLAAPDVDGRQPGAVRGATGSSATLE